MKKAPGGNQPVRLSVTCIPSFNNNNADGSVKSVTDGLVVPALPTFSPAMTLKIDELELFPTNDSDVDSSTMLDEFRYGNEDMVLGSSAIHLNPPSKEQVQEEEIEDKLFLSSKNVSTNALAL
jgi:hypothetical protein